MPQTMLVTTRRVAANKPQVVDAYMKAIVEAIAYMLDPTNKETVTRAMAVNLRLSNASEADEAYKAVIGVSERLPYPTADGMKRLHGLLTIVNPKLVDAKVETMIDDSFVRRLDTSGFAQALPRNAERIPPHILEDES